MVESTALVRNDALIADAIATFPTDAIGPALAESDDPTVQAGLAIAAGLSGDTGLADALLPLLDEEGLAGRAASWALAHLVNATVLQEQINGGSLDQRENGYQALIGLIALGRAERPALAAFAEQRLTAELDRAKQGFTGLGEQVCQLLVVCGAEQSDASIQRVIEEDPHTDRFELQRLRKQLAEHGTDQETVDAWQRDWRDFFADDLAGNESDTAAADEPVAATAVIDHPTSPAPEPMVDASFEPIGSETPPHQPTTGEEAATGEEAPQNIDWQAFIDSPEAGSLDDTSRQLLQQLGPMLEQLVARSAGISLPQLHGQELAAVLLQILPQALPPQAVQAALSPQAINGFQALVKWLANTDQATDGPGLLEGIKLLREQLRESVRASGMLGGPDYSDPDESDAPA